MNDLYAIPSIPSSIQPNRTESEISFIVPVERRNHVVNPSFETDNIGDTQPYNWSVGQYSYANNALTNVNSIGSVVSENSYVGTKALRVALSDTTTSLVYGISIPIVVPNSMPKSEYINGESVYYNIRGALSFHVFAPPISPLSPFSVLNQPAGTIHPVTVNVYANVDANGVPSGDFNTQNIITSASVPIRVQESAFFDEDIEPNVVGRRKNPFWERYYVYFNVQYVPEKQTLLRFSFSNPAMGVNGSNFLFYLDAVQVEFFDDDFPYPTTYLDGNKGNTDPLEVSGYYWDGAPQRSTSYRSASAFSGGVLFNLESDFLFQTLSITGLGMPNQENQLTPFVMSDGQQYNGTGIEGRKMTIGGHIAGGTFLEVLRKAGQLQYLLSNERLGVSSVRRFYFRIPSSACEDASEYVYFNAVIERVSVEPISETPDVIISIELNNLDVYFYTDNYAYSFPTVLNPVRKLRRFDMIMFHAQGGRPLTEYNPQIRLDDVRYQESFYGHNQYSLYTNGMVHAWLELDNGSILFGGRFTKVTYTINGVNKGVYCNHIALLKTDGTVVPIRDRSKRNNARQYNKTNGAFGPSAVVRSIIQTNDGGIVIGGRFNRFVGRAYDCMNIVYIPNLNSQGEVVGEFRDVEGGLTGDGATGVFTLVYHRETERIFVGGFFQRAVNRNTGGVVALRNAAIYYINRGFKWESLYFGFNNTVFSMAITKRQSSNILLVGGEFTAAYANASTSLITQTQYSCAYLLNSNIANNKRIVPLTFVSATTTASTLPVRNSAFNNKVYVIHNDNLDNTYIGGEFDKIDFNTNLLPAQELQDLGVSRIVKWDGFNNFTLMESGLRNTEFLSYPLSVFDIASNPNNQDVYVAGKFSAIGSLNPAFCVARWSKNRWESVGFEAQIEKAWSVFISKRGYGFVSVSTFAPRSKKNTLYTAMPIVIDNVGLSTQCVIEISNPNTNRFDADVISIYNETTNKSISLNLTVAVGETITFDFTRPNVKPVSNIRNIVSNSLVGGGTFSNFYLTSGRNVLKILGAQRNGILLDRPIQVSIRYFAKQISPLQVYETGLVKNKDVGVGWNLGKSRMGLDTRLYGNMKTAFPNPPDPVSSWATYVTWTLDRDGLSNDAIINE